MQPNAVKLPVVASVPLDCVFSPEDDGWTGECAEFSVRVRGGNFEEAKKHMEASIYRYTSSRSSVTEESPLKLLRRRCIK